MRNRGESQHLSCNPRQLYCNFNTEHLLCFQNHDNSSCEFRFRRLGSFPTNLKSHLWNNFIFVLRKALTKYSKYEIKIVLRLEHHHKKKSLPNLLFYIDRKKAFLLNFHPVTRVIILNHIGKLFC